MVHRLYEGKQFVNVLSTVVERRHEVPRRPRMAVAFYSRPLAVGNILLNNRGRWTPNTTQEKLQLVVTISGGKLLRVVIIQHG